MGAAVGINVGAGIGKGILFISRAGGPFMDVEAEEPLPFLHVFEQYAVVLQLSFRIQAPGPHLSLIHISGAWGGTDGSDFPPATLRPYAGVGPACPGPA